MNKPPTTTPASASSAYVCCAAVCPMCGLSSMQYRLNPRQYWHTSRDLDLQPNGYRFRGVAVEVHPPLLAMWHCNSCYFTAENNDFQAPLKDVLIRSDTVSFGLRERARTDPAFHRVIEALHADLHLDALDFYQSIKLHLLAFLIWDEIGNMVKKDYLTQAKYSLQLAWLYRDMQAVDPVREQTVARLEVLFAELQPDWPGLLKSETAALQKAIDYYEASLAISTFCKDAMNEVTALHRLGRIQMKLKDLRVARDTFRKSTIRAQTASVEIRQQLAIRAGMPGREEVTGTAREALIDRERRLASIILDESRLTDLLREDIAKLQPARK